MKKNATLSVRVTEKTRQILARAAGERGVSGASALAARILEQWVANDEARDRLWEDEPSDFFPHAGKG